MPTVQHAPGCALTGSTVGPHWGSVAEDGQSAAVYGRGSPPKVLPRRGVVLGAVWSGVEGAGPREG